MTDVIDKLTPEQAWQIVRRLADKGGAIREALVAEATGLLTDIDRDDLAQQVFEILDEIDVQDCWNRAGGSRDDYVGPDDAAAEIFEEQLQPYVDQLKRYHDLGMPEQEAAYCEGVILGVYRYEKESKSEFRNWCEDMPAECAGDLLDAWKKRNREKVRRAAMDSFVRAHCPDWVSWLTDK